VRRADGVPAYQLAVVVDDIAMRITEVVRGEDLLASTVRQILLYRAFGATPPTFAHVPLLLGTTACACRRGIAASRCASCGTRARRRRRSSDASRSDTACAKPQPQ
jgi:glutamyl/glutaminyl-tRNA synthetase